MAQTPQGRPRAGESSTAATQQQLKSQLIGALTGATPFPIFGDRLAPLRQAAPGLNPTVTIGGQKYREFDDGRANVLVPASDPLVSRAQLAQQQQAVVRALLMAQNPFAGAAHGVATLANASPRTRETALIAGGVADSTMSAGAPRVSSVRRLALVRQGQAVPPTLARDVIRPSNLNATGQAGRVEATAIAPMLGTGTDASRRIRPPGFEGGAAGHSRGHLFPKLLGGSGKDPRNLVTLNQTPTNHPHMSSFDEKVARQVRSGEVIEYSSTPLYSPGIGPPGAILMTATGSNGTRMAKLVQNPAGRPR